MKKLVIIILSFLMVGCNLEFISSNSDYTEVWLHTIAEDDCKMIVLGDGIDTLRVDTLWTLKESDPSRSPMNTSRLTVASIGKYEYFTVMNADRFSNEYFKSDIQTGDRVDIYVKLSLKGDPVEFPSDSLDFSDIVRKH